MGYGMGDLEIIDYAIEKFGKARKEELYRRLYIFLPFYQTDEQIAEAEQLYFNEIKMQIIPYAIDENGYSQIYHVLAEWKEFMTAEKDSEFLRNLKLIERNL
jgi:flagellar biosynthesis regulator FlbT